MKLFIICLFKITPDEVVMALQGADAYVKSYKKRHGWKDP